MSEQSMRPPAIPVPQANMVSMLKTLEALKQAVELMNGSAGEKIQRSVTFVDLINLGVVKKNQVPEKSTSLPRRV